MLHSEWNWPGTVPKLLAHATSLCKKRIHVCIYPRTEESFKSSNETSKTQPVRTQSSHTPVLFARRQIALRLPEMLFWSLVTWVLSLTLLRKSRIQDARTSGLPCFIASRLPLEVSLLQNPKKKKTPPAGFLLPKWNWLLFPLLSFLTKIPSEPWTTDSHLFPSLLFSRKKKPRHPAYERTTVNLLANEGKRD